MKNTTRNGRFMELLRVLFAAAQLVITALFTEYRYLGISCYVLAALIVILMIKPCLSKETYIRRDSVKRGVIIFVAIIVPDVIRQFILWETLPKPVEPILTMLLTFYGVLLGASYQPIMKDELLAQTPEGTKSSDDE